MEVAARRLVWVARTGAEQSVRAPDRAYVYPRMSPDGIRVALSIRDGQDDISMWDLARETLTKVTAPGAQAKQYPVWMPDGHRLLFGTGLGIFRQAADGTGALEPQAPAAGQGQGVFPYTITPDGALRRGTQALGALS